MRAPPPRLLAILLLVAVLLPEGSQSFGQEQGQADEQERGGPTNLWQPGPPSGWNFQTMSPAQRQRMLRSWTFINNKVPQSYLEASNTVGYTTKAIADGGPLYQAQCRRCHGETGLGNGELAMDLTPGPALLAHLGAAADRARPIFVVEHLGRRQIVRHRHAGLQGRSEPGPDLVDRRLFARWFPRGCRPERGTSEERDASRSERRAEPSGEALSLRSCCASSDFTPLVLQPNFGLFHPLRCGRVRPVPSNLDPNTAARAKRLAEDGPRPSRRA